MDSTSIKRCLSTEGGEELAEAEEPEPDLIPKHTMNEKRKGRFIIEEIEEVNDGRQAHRNIKKDLRMSFRRNKFDFFHRELSEEENDYIAQAIGPLTFIYENIREDFINVEEIFAHNKLNFDFLIKFTDVYYENTISEEDLNFPADYVMIVQETVENESNWEDLRCKPLINSECVRSPEEANKTKSTQNILKSIKFSFDLKLNENIKSPSCSPIGSPKRSHQITNSQFKNLKSSSKINKVRMLNNFIKSIDDSFRLDNDQETNKCYKTSTGTFFRNKRIHSEDKVKNLKSMKLFDFDCEEGYKKQNESRFQMISTSGIDTSKYSIQHIYSISLIPVRRVSEFNIALTPICEKCLSGV